ncbi:MAG: hypothetical protein HKO59_11895 [Phycisphaerales bacterium]|nr:hypothetical protein [Phycisphaerales bacterium]NNM26664.1 hypothetical protein [Phycisphaerales bacterium]
MTNALHRRNHPSAPSAPSAIASLVLAAGLTAPAAAGGGDLIVEFPDPALFFQNTTFAIEGDAGFVPSFDEDVLWSFSLTTGELIDRDGLALAGNASDPFLFADHRLAIPGFFPGQGVFVADVSDPAHLTALGVIDFPATTNIQGQNIEIDDDGVTGYVAGFPDDTLYAFDVVTLTRLDALPLPGNPDRIKRAGDRVAMVDTANGRILVADVSSPRKLALAGIIELPGVNTFGSNDNIVFAGDGRTGFVSTNERVVYAFDVLTLELTDPDGFVIGTQLSGDHLAIHGNTLACLWSRGLAFLDVSDPTNLTLIADAAFGEVVAPQGSATVAFSGDGTRAVTSVVFPGHRVYAFEVETGAQLASSPLTVSEQPNYLTVFGRDRIGVICSGVDADNIWLIDSVLPAGCVADLDGSGDVGFTDLLQMLARWGVCVDCPQDLDGSGDVGFIDLLTLLAAWGPCR